jgi:hypothetical protein
MSHRWSVLVGLAALLALLPVACHAAYFEARVGMLDEGVAHSDGVVFILRVLDAQGTPLATLLEKPVAERGFTAIRRDLSAFGGQKVKLELQVTPGASRHVQWDWAVWYKPVVRSQSGEVLLDLLEALPQAEAGYMLDGVTTLVGKGVQWNPDGGRDHGIMVWHGDAVAPSRSTLKQECFKVRGRGVVRDVLFMHPIWENVAGNTIVRYTLNLPEGEPPMPDVDTPEFIPSGFRGDVEAATLKPASEVTPLKSGDGQGDVDLVAMARWAIEYLCHNPSPERNYETRFGIMPLQMPPSPRLGDVDGVAFGDTESRMDWEFIFMRDMTGCEKGTQIEQIIWDRILGYIRDDGLSWLRSDLLCWSDPEGPRPAAMNWTTDETLVSLVERYHRSGDPDQLRLARKLFQGLRSIASWDTGRAYYAGGMDGMREGKWIGSACGQQYPSILDPITRYWEASGDPEALEFARAFAEGQLADLQPNCGACRINSDGSFGGFNTHLHMRPTLGMAHLGAVLHEPRYLEWARRVYEFTRSMGTDWGWYPESPSPDHPYSETCNMADMVDVAMWLARAGYSEYWDHVERTVRNYTTAAQWFVTPEYEALYARVHPNNPAGVAEAMGLMRRYDGGFYSCLTPNDWVWDASPGGMNMMGCCPPEGMRSLHTAWDNTVLETERGVEVNLAFNVDRPAARVVSFLPTEGRVTVVVKRAADFYLRPPSWAPRGQVRAFVNGQPVEPQWQGAHVVFPAAQAGTELTITYPLVDFRQHLKVAGKQYTYHWLGNTVVGVEPRGQFLPIFTQVPRQLPPPPE